jgi:PAS domain S-box-containing protein
MATDLKRLRGRLAAARADVEGRASEHELDVALEEIQALWDELGEYSDRLMHERERYAALFERAPFACLVTDVHGNVCEANVAALALLEVPSEYLRGKPLAIFIADEQRESFRMHLAMAARTPARPVEAWTTLLTSSRGEPREVKVDLRPLPANEENFLPLLWFLRDTG